MSRKVKRKHPPTDAHNYVVPMLDYALKIRDALEPGQLHHIGVFHDDWCHVFDDGFCNCEPEFKRMDKGKRFA